MYDVNQLVELPAWCSALGGEVFATNATSGGAYVMHSALLLSSQLNFKILGGYDVLRGSNSALFASCGDSGDDSAARKAHRHLPMRQTANAGARFTVSDEYFRRRRSTVICVHDTACGVPSDFFLWVGRRAPSVCYRCALRHSSP